MTKVHNCPLEELHRVLVSEEITIQDLTKATFKRIKETEPETEAFITLNGEKASERVKALDERDIGESNTLAGIPIGIKDNVVTKDILITAASKIPYNFEPTYDATVMNKIYQVDMIPIGKLNMDESAMSGSTETSYFKKTKNAWDQTKVPRGSSGGSAVAVAAGQIPVSLGSDMGGSIRQPAAFNSTVGMRSIYGRASRFGLVASASSLDQIGSMTCTVKDNALTLTAISGHDEKDGTSSGVSVPDFAEGLTGDIKGTKIALPKECLGEGVASGVKEAILKAAETFRSLGAIVEEVSSPYLKYGVAVYYTIASPETGSNLQRSDGICYGYRPENVELLDDVYVNSRSEGFGEGAKRHIMLDTFSLSAGYCGAYFKKAGQVCILIKRDSEKVFADYDLIIGPSSPTVVFETGENINGPTTMYASDILTIPINLAGLPGMSVPAGLSEGLPAGLQIAGNYFGEKTMYQVAYAFEQAIEFYIQQPAILGGRDE